MPTYTRCGSLSLDIAGDWEVVDKTQTVTFLSRLTESTFHAAESVANVLRQDVSKDEMEARRLLGKAATCFHMWAAKVASGRVPKVHDVIVDAAGQRWSVQDVGVKAWSSRYECWVVAER